MNNICRKSSYVGMSYYELRGDKSGPLSTVIEFSTILDHIITSLNLNSYKY